MDNLDDTGLVDDMHTSITGGIAGVLMRHMKETWADVEIAPMKEDGNYTNEIRIQTTSAGNYIIAVYKEPT